MSKIKNEIYKKFKDKYEKIVEDSFNKFFELTSVDLVLPENNKTSINSLLRNTIRPTKKRWIKIIMNQEESTYNQEVSSAKTQYDKMKNGEIEESKFKSFFGALDIGEYKSRLLNELNKWTLDDNLYLTDFKYLTDLRKKSIISAFKNDINLFYLLQSEEQQTLYNENSAVTKLPTILSELPIDTTCKIDYLTEAQKNNLEINNEKDTLNTLDKLVSLQGDEQDEILMKLEKKTYLEIKKGGNPNKFLDMMTQIALLKSIKYLNSFDTKIITYYYNHFDHVFTGSPIDKTFYQIAKELELPNTSKYYEYIEDSLAKMGSINMTYNIEGNKLYGNLLTCMLYNENGIKKAQVYLGGILQNLVIRDSAFEYDKEIFNRLSSTSQQLAIWLQKRRYNLAIKKDEFRDSIALKTFSNAIYFSSKRADRNRKKIIESLDELKNIRLIIQDYNYDKKIDNAVLQYMSLTIKEKKKLGLLEEDIISNDEEYVLVNV